MSRNPQISAVALAAEVGMASTSGVEKHLKTLREAGCTAAQARPKAAPGK